jgi:hypothetical protein
MSGHGQGSSGPPTATKRKRQTKEKKSRHKDSRKNVNPSKAGIKKQKAKPSPALEAALARGIRNKMTALGSGRVRTPLQFPRLVKPRFSLAPFLAFVVVFASIGHTLGGGQERQHSLFYVANCAVQRTWTGRLKTVNPPRHHRIPVSCCTIATKSRPRLFATIATSTHVPR